MVWGNCDQTHRNRLQRLQNRAASVTGDSYDVRSHEILNKIKMENFARKTRRPNGVEGNEQEMPREHSEFVKDFV